MSRRKLPDEKVRHVERLAGKALPQKEIAEIVGISVGAVNKILKAAPTPAPVPPSTVDVSDVPEEIPEGLSDDVVDKWIKKVEDAAAKAEAAKDFTAMASLTAKLIALLEHKRKAAPRPKEDPNDNPDMIAASERGLKEFLRLIDHSLITRVTSA